MPTREVTIEIAADPQSIFDLLHDYDRRLSWDPFLREARLLNGERNARLGATARCVARKGIGGLAMETVYISFEPARVAAVRMTRGPFILARFAATIRHRRVSESLTRVIYRYHLRARPGWLRPLLDPLLHAIFLRETRMRLEALKRNLESPSVES